jgi:hypothetical protein
MLNPMSEEQYQVYQLIQSGKNAIVDACAGSGKSTTILSIAKELPEKRILQFTYNSMLRHEIREKTQDLALQNIEVHTYHSFAVKYYSSIAHTDTGIRQILREQLLPRTPVPVCDILVLDECQDMTLLYFHLVAYMCVHMCKETDHKIQILILGDYMQGLYEFKGADIRFLTCAEQCWQGFRYLLSHDFVKCTLKTSYRITNQMASFVNRDMLGDVRIQACRDGGPVVYIRRPRYLLEKIAVYNIKQLLDQGESPSDIFVLGGSVKGPNSPIRRMENVLTENGIPCHVPMFETDAMDERVIEGKIVFSTFHSVKGRQRKYVFVVGFDNSYYFIARDIPRDVCPNTLYVATTRATHGLFLLDNDSSKPLEFLKQNQHVMKQSNYIDFKGLPQTIFHDPIQDPDLVLIPTYHVSPTDLIKFLSEDLLEDITPIIETMFFQEGRAEPESEILEIPKIHYTRSGYYEDVSDLNGIALPALFFDFILGNNTEGQDSIKSMIRSSIVEMRDNEHTYLRTMVDDIPDRCKTVSEYLYMANVYVAIQERLYFKLKQISRDEYTWLSDEILEKCKERFDDYLGYEFQDAQPEIECQIIHYNNEELQVPIERALNPYFGNDMKFRFCARVDLLSEYCLYELKCTSTITVEHKLQVVLYAWIWQILHPDDRRVVKIYNVRTNEKWVLNAPFEDLEYIVVALLKNKYCDKKILEMDDFVGKCRAVLEQVSIDKVADDI